MGKLIDGKWTDGLVQVTGIDGSFVRADSAFRNWVTPDGAPGPTGTGGFAAEAGRYHLYVAYACPWAHRTLIFRKLKDLEPLISISVVHPDMFDEGWTFDTDLPGTTGDTLFGLRYLREIYQKSDPHATTRVTVPVLWDKKTNQIVSNESAEIIRMFNSAFNEITGNRDDYWPKALHDEIDAINLQIYHTVNNGVYRAGFASSQTAYDKAAIALFETLDQLETRLDANRYLLGDRPTEADWRLFPTLMRFDLVYHLHFKCNRKRLIDYPNLWAYTRELYQWPGVRETVNFDHTVRHYYRSHESINPHRIIPINPLIDWDEPHGRG